MNLDLLLKLKAAGFPFKTCDIQKPKHLQKSGIIIFGGDPILYKEPNLKELIDACGGIFGKLERMSYGKWYTTSIGASYSVYGETPEESLGNFYLATHK